MGCSRGNKAQVRRSFYRGEPSARLVNPNLQRNKHAQQRSNCQNKEAGQGKVRAGKGLYLFPDPCLFGLDEERSNSPARFFGGEKTESQQAPVT